MRSLRRTARRVMTAAILAGAGWLWLRTEDLQVVGTFLGAVLILIGLAKIPRRRYRPRRRPPRTYRPRPIGDRAVRLEQAATWLYEWADDTTGEIVYVGITNDLDRRIDQHGADKPWQRPGITMRVVAKYPTRSEALAAEKAAIQRDRPRWNTQHNGGRSWVG